jgi:DNA-binding Lrp family transcriptional regulator
MKPLFVQIKCSKGQTFDVSEKIVDHLEETSEIYSISGQFDLLAKFYLRDDDDEGSFVVNKLQKIDGVLDTYTFVAFRLFRLSPGANCNTMGALSISAEI